MTLIRLPPPLPFDPPQALQQGNVDGAQIYASNAIRKKTESLNLLRLSSRIDAVASRVETAVTMRQVTGSMSSVVKGMDKAMESMNLERISGVMDKFEGQFSDLDVQTNYMENAMGSTTATTTPQDQVDNLINQVADEAGLELQHELVSGKAPAERLATPVQKEAETRTPVAVGEEDGSLADRLRALRVSRVELVCCPPPGPFPQYLESFGTLGSLQEAN